MYQNPTYQLQQMSDYLRALGELGDGGDWNPSVYNYYIVCKFYREYGQ